MNTEGRFDVIVHGVLRTYRRWGDIPVVFDHVVRFEPAIPPAPHTPEQHAEAALWDARLQTLMEMERARRDENRRR
jgi:hypothetical protein